jgi:hypothetical protein
MAAKLKIEKRGDEIKKKSSPLKLLSQSQPNFAEMILVWSPFKNVSVSAILYPRWPPLLKIEISSNGQNCPILSHKVPKFAKSFKMKNKIDEKRAITPRWVIKFTSKLQGR